MDRKLPYVIIVCALILAGLFVQFDRCFGHSGDSLSAWAVLTPTIDGVVDSDEWIDADVADFVISYCGESHDVTLYVKNDATNLYLAVQFRDEEYSNLAEMYHDFSNFYFDNNNNGIVETGEDGLAIRFDNTIFRDTYNPIGVNGWSYSDDTDGGSNDIVGATTHTNPVPDGMGTYTFEYQHPLDSADNTHDFSLSAGDTVGFRYSFPDGETGGCQPVSYHWPSSFPGSYADIVIASVPKLKLLFVPMKWTGTQADFDTSVDTQIDFFIDAIPLSACPDEVSISKLDVATQNFSGFTCGGGSCGVGTISPFVSGLGIDTTAFDIIIGLIEISPCPPIAGCSNGSDTIWVETEYDSVAAHEIGHIFDLEDEYCSNQAGSTDERCNDGGVPDDYNGDGITPPADVNPLHAETTPHPCDCPPDGSNDSGGAPCCNFTLGTSTYNCATVNYGICCLGNESTAGGRAIMSFADVDVYFPGTRAFDEHSRAHFATLPELNCDAGASMRFAPIIAIRLDIFPDDRVLVKEILKAYGRPSRISKKKDGDYRLVAYVKGEKSYWSQSFDIHFDYDGPVYLKKDYSRIKYSSFPVSYRVPYVEGMDMIVLYHKDKVIFKQRIDFCNEDKKCGPTESNLTCPNDCPADKPDKICIDRKDGVCDPDCLKGIDPDCEGECGNKVCNTNESYKSCPKDCISGGDDGYCDGKEDGRCDPDCKEGEKDPDCRSTCGDGKCTSVDNPFDPQASENFGNCPRDCKSGGKDYYCDGVKDGVCDPDCKSKEDPDCKDRFVIIVIIVIIIILLLLFIFIRKRPKSP